MGRRLLRGLAVAAFWLALWWGAAAAVRQELLIPTPAQVAVTLWHAAGTAAFWRAAGASLWRIVLGFIGGVLAGCLLAGLTVHFSTAYALLSPLLKIVRTTPVASFIILALVWLQTDVLPAVIAALMVMPVVWGNVDKGLREVDGRLLEMAQVFSVGKGRVWLDIRLPAVMPYFLSACTTSLGLAWKSGVAAEVICRPAQSLGHLLQTAKNHLETAEVFAYTAVVIVLSVLLEHLFLWVVRRLGRRYNVQGGGAA